MNSTESFLKSKRKGERKSESEQMVEEKEIMNVKLVVLGDAKVGKSSLLKRFAEKDGWRFAEVGPTHATELVSCTVQLKDKRSAKVDL